MNNIAIYLIIMAIVTYMIRAIPLVLMQGKNIESKFLKRFLDFTPYAVLGSMTFPFIFYSTENKLTGIIGTVIAIVLSYLNKGLTKVAVYTVILIYLIDIIIDMI
ncbi:MAG: AzlD domain-containing protein [Andreesenia angusta]|nr:AzlD domain-containing protein [Andreesenia angusta]